ncbi:MAG TPA: chemotaxis protein CheW [Bryobacteraceae bacterium]|jgi:chemotaxis signal transduction protein|nr:chemotaxis protein CheW [Bryobacteraceae bacterium]
MRQYITFRVARQDFAMDAMRIRGLLPLHEMTFLPSSAEAICGAASIRGHDFPVVDLRKKLAIPAGAIGRQPCIVAVEIRGARLIGFIADRVSEVIELRPPQVRKDRVRITGRPRRLLDPDRILTDEELDRFYREGGVPSPKSPVCASAEGAF